MDNRALTDLARALEPEVPNAAERINHLLGDGTLHDMCMEYEDCMKSLRFCLNSPRKHEDRIAEYTEVLVDLRQEILQYLREHGS